MNNPPVHILEDLETWLIDLNRRFTNSAKSSSNDLTMSRYAVDIFSNMLKQKREKETTNEK